MNETRCDEYLKEVECVSERACKRERERGGERQRREKIREDDLRENLEGSLTNFEINVVSFVIYCIYSIYFIVLYIFCTFIMYCIIYIINQPHTHSQIYLFLVNVRNNFFELNVSGKLTSDSKERRCTARFPQHSVWLSLFVVLNPLSVHAVSSNLKQ